MKLFYVSNKSVVSKRASSKPSVVLLNLIVAVVILKLVLLSTFLSQEKITLMKSIEFKKLL